MKKIKIHLIKYIGGTKKIEDEFEMDVDENTPEIKKQTKIKKITDKSILNIISSLNGENQLYVHDEKIKETLNSKTSGSIFISIKNIKQPKTKKMKIKELIDDDKKEENLKNESNFLKLIKWLSRKYKNKLKIDEYANAYIKWDSTQQQLYSFFIYEKDNDLYHDTFRLDKRIEKKIIIKDFGLKQYGKLETKQIFKEILEKYIKNI